MYTDEAPCATALASDSRGPEHPTPVERERLCSPRASAVACALPRNGVGLGEVASPDVHARIVTDRATPAHLTARGAGQLRLVRRHGHVRQCRATGHPIRSPDRDMTRLSPPVCSRRGGHLMRKEEALRRKGALGGLSVAAGGGGGAAGAAGAAAAVRGRSTMRRDAAGGTCCARHHACRYRGASRRRVAA